MTTEDVQGQLGRSAAVERELREQLAGLKAALAKSEREVAHMDEAYAACVTDRRARVAAATARIAELEGALRGRGIHDRTCSAVKVPGRFGSQEGLRWNQSTDPLSCTCPLGVAILGCELGKTPPNTSRAALAPNAPPKVDALPLPYIGTPGRQGCHPAGCPMPGLHTITSCNWFRQQLHRFGRHVPGCTLNGEDCSCGLLQMLAGRPLAATRLDAAPHADREPGEERFTEAADVIRARASQASPASSGQEVDYCLSDVCDASRVDGVVCAEGECDIALGIRKNPAQPRPAPPPGKADAPAAAQAQKCCPVGATAATCPWRDFVSGAPCECACHRAPAAAQEPGAKECKCVRTERYIENRGNCPVHPAPSRFPDHNGPAGPVWRDKVAPAAHEEEQPAQEPEQGEARGRELRFQRCIHEVCGLSDDISEDPTAIEVGQAPDGSWVAWHEDYPGDGSVRLTGGVLAEIARAQEAPADAAPPAQAEPDALREALTVRDVISPTWRCPHCGIRFWDTEGVSEEDCRECSPLRRMLHGPRAIAPPATRTPPSEWRSSKCKYTLAEILVQAASRLPPSFEALHDDMLEAAAMLPKPVGPPEEERYFPGGADLMGEPAPAPRSGIPLLDHAFVPNTWAAVDACDARVSDPGSQISRQCGRPRKEHPAEEVKPEGRK